jgi:hypothetical protein
MSCWRSATGKNSKLCWFRPSIVSYLHLDAYLLLPGGPSVVPECYCIEMDHMQEEQESPNSQDFYAVNPSEFGVHLWSNSLYVIALLLRKSF